ncbi:hypothetical protein DelCs14_2813 [Delftia sp. Cs1-4]|nr:hypothetical protein DelCs14_2813 [Delftia sp. Cs1-4]OBY85026.1 hypothetical protein ACM14_13450 [Delftia sp. JD2]
MDSMLSDVVWTMARLATLVGLPALIAWTLVARPSWREPFRLASLALVPCLITLWFMHDGGLGNGLNRLAYYMATAAFLAIYTGLAAIALLMQRHKKQRAQASLRALCLGALALLAWITGAVAFESLG